MTWLNIIVVAIVALAGLANLFLAIYVYKKNPGVRVNQKFFYFGLVLFLWCFVNVIALATRELFWLKVVYSVGSIVPLTGVFFAYALADKKINIWIAIFLSAVCAVFFMAGLFTPLLLKDLISFSDFGITASFGPLFDLWGVYLIFLILTAISIPLTVLKKVDELRKKQILYYLLGAIAFATWAIFVDIILPALGFTKLANLDSPATIFLAGFASYAIIKYHLMNISSFIFQAFIYSLVIVLIVALLLLVMFVSFFFFQRIGIWPIYVIAALISIMLFFIGRLFFVEKRDLEKTKINLTELLQESERNRIRAEMERDKVTTIINSFSDGIVILDEKGEIFSINPETEKILELQAIRLLKKPLQALADFPRAKPIISLLDAGFRGVFREEVSLTKDLIIELSVKPFNLYENGIGHLIVLHDVSREKRVEKMKSEFVSLAAHQLRTPLSIIKWSMSMLKKGDYGKLSGKQVDVIKTTFQNNERLISLVNDLLNITHIEEGRYLYKVAMSDVNKIVKTAIDSYNEESDKRKIKIEFTAPDNLPQTMVDSEKIKLVVQNLIDNAIKYSHDGEKIIVTLKNDEKNIEFKIEDFGIGIPDNNKENIFTKFSRGDNAIKVNSIGSGLGLFLVKNIVEAHGGKIWFESKENTGTSFYFSLPIKKN